MLHTYSYAYFVILKQTAIPKNPKRLTFNLNEDGYWLVSLVGSEFGIIQDSQGNRLRVSIKRKLIVRPNKRKSFEELMLFRNTG